MSSSSGCGSNANSMVTKTEGVWHNLSTACILKDLPTQYTAWPGPSDACVIPASPAAGKQSGGTVTSISPCHVR